LASFTLDKVSNFYSQFFLVCTGWFAAKALEDPEKYSGRVIPLAGDSLSIPELQDVYEKANGVRPWKAPIPGVAIRLLPHGVRSMFLVGGYPDHAYVLID
jgi:hypothetical protein